MRSTYFTDKTESADARRHEDDAEKLQTKGFFPVATALLLIYVMTSRPVLYKSIYEWFSQLIELLVNV